jgi:hypothetical protein
VDDNKEDGIDTATVSVNVHDQDDVGNENNDRPTAVAKVDKNDVNEGQTVTLDASRSYDANGDQLSFSWQQIGDNPSVTTSGPHDSITTFSAPAVDADITLQYNLTVDDTKQDGIDTATVSVNVHDQDVVERRTGLLDINIDNIRNPADAGGRQIVDITIRDSLSELKINSAKISAEVNCPPRTFETNGATLHMDWNVGQAGTCEIRIHAEADGYASRDLLENFQIVIPGPD